MRVGLCEGFGVVVGEVLKARDDACAERLIDVLFLGEPDGGEGKTDHLRGEGFGGGDAHFGARVAVDATVHFAGDERVYYVDYADGDGGGRCGARV